MLQTQIICAALIVLALLIIINIVRLRKIDLKYALPWIMVFIILLIVDLFPVILFYISKCMGIATPVNTLYLLAFCFAIALIFILTITVSKMSEKIAKLSQVVAINQEKIEKMDKELEKLYEKNNSNGM